MSMTLFITILVPCLVLLGSGLFIVKQQSVALIERLGRFTRTAHAGLNIKIPFIEHISGEVSLRIQQLDVAVETKTKDNVFINIQVSVQYRVKEQNVYEAFYKLNNGHEQITAYVFDVVRSEVPKMLLDSVFEAKENIAQAVNNELTETMISFGYEIIKALITDIQPDEKVKAAMNEINEQQRLRYAANEKGEAEKILKVKQAEGEAESKKLQGEGIANQRKAIIEGLRQSVEEFNKAIPGVNAAEAMQLVLITQYLDTLKEIGANGKNSSILIPHSPSAISDLGAQLRDAIISGHLATESKGEVGR